MKNMLEKEINFWLLITIIALIAIFALLLFLALASGLSAKGNVNQIETKVGSVQSGFEKLGTQGADTLRSMGGFSIDAISKVSKIEKDASKAKEKFDTLTQTGQNALNDFVFDFCNLDLQPQNSSLRFPVRNGTTIANLCRDVPDIAQHRTLTFTDGVEASFLLADLIRALGIPAS